MSSSSSSVLDPESDTSHSWSPMRAVLVIVVLAEADAEPEDDVAAAAADVEANEDPALGGCGSGVMLVRRVSQAAPPSGLMLLSRSPRPSKRACRISRRDLSILLAVWFKDRTLSESDVVDLPIN